MKLNPVSPLRGVSQSDLLRLMTKNKITNKCAYECYVQEIDDVPYELFCKRVVRQISLEERDIDRKALIESLKNKDSYVVIKPKKSRKLTKMNMYREEVVRKVRENKVDFLNTKIRISNRDMYSVLYELNIDISHLSKTNFSKNHINWHGIEKFIEELKSNKITMGDFIRIVRANYKKDIGITTIKYKLRENNFKKTSLNYNESTLYQKLKEKEIKNKIEKSDKVLSYNDFKAFSFGELAYYTGLTLHEVYSRYNKAIKEDESIIEWARLINKHNIQCLEYKLENIEDVKKDIENFPIKDVSVKYKIPISTLKDWINKK